MIRQRLGEVGNRATALLERLERAPGVGALAVAVRRFTDHLGFQAAAATAYQSFLSLFPLLILTVSVTNLVLDDSQRADLANRISEFFALAPDGTKGVSEALTAVSKQSLSTGLIGAALLAWTGTSAIGQVRSGLERAFEANPSDILGMVARARDLLLLPFFVLLILLCAGTAAIYGVSITVAGWIAEHSAALGRFAHLAEGTIGPLLLWALCTVALLIAYTVVPRARPAVRDRLVGAWIAGLLLVGLLLGYASVLARSARLGAIYGSLASTATLLILLQLAGAVTFFGAEIAQSRAARRAASML